MFSPVGFNWLSIFCLLKHYRKTSNQTHELKGQHATSACSQRDWGPHRGLLIPDDRTIENLMSSTIPHPTICSATVLSAPPVASQGVSPMWLPPPCFPAPCCVNTLESCKESPCRVRGWPLLPPRPHPPSLQCLRRPTCPLSLVVSHQQSWVEALLSGLPWFVTFPSIRVSGY